MGVEQVVLAQPRGFCAGVQMAVEKVERALREHGPPIYVFHEIVHNRIVVEELARRGVEFVRSMDEVPPGAALARFRLRGKGAQDTGSRRVRRIGVDRRRLSRAGS